MNIGMWIGVALAIISILIIARLLWAVHQANERNDDEDSNGYQITSLVFMAVFVIALIIFGVSSCVAYANPNCTRGYVIKVRRQELRLMEQVALLPVSVTIRKAEIAGIKRDTKVSLEVCPPQKRRGS